MTVDPAGVAVGGWAVGVERAALARWRVGDPNPPFARSLAHLHGSSARRALGHEQKKPLGSFRSRGADPQPRTPLYGVCEVTTFASAAGALVDAVAAGEGAGVAETEPSADACAAACFSAASAAFPFFCFGWAFFAAVVR